MKSFVIVAISMMFAGSAFAAGYGDAGCGLGSVVFGNSRGFMQVFAATTNGTFGSQTFGISSGTSNCGGSGKAATAFIEVNKASLKNDIAKGQGETVNALAMMYGCKDASELGSALQGNYQQVFKTNEAASINKNIKHVIIENELSCKLG